MNRYIRHILYSKPETAGKVINIQQFKKDKHDKEFETIKKQLAAVGIEIRITGHRRAEGEREYRVNHKNGIEATAYYSTDLDDAYLTGLGLSHHDPMEEASAEPLQSVVSGILTKVQRKGNEQIE